MKLKRLLWIVLPLAFIVTPLCAQTAHLEMPQVFAPFVSGLQGEVRNGFIRLSWVDSKDVKGPVYIYRSANPFSDTVSLKDSGIRPVTIPYGTQTHVDEIDARGTMYFFAVASDETGKTYELPITSKNTISVQASSEGYISSQTSTPIAVEKAIPEVKMEPPSGISALDAVAQNDRIIVTYNPGKVKNVALYRSIRPISQTQDLLGAVILQTKIHSPFTDYPVTGIQYYYAAVDEEDLINGTIEIIPGRNATRAPVGLTTAGFEPGREMRAIQLPQLSTQAIAPGMSAYTEMPTQDLSPEAQAALGVIPARFGEAEQKKPRVFARDLETPAERGEDHVLASLVNGSFSDKNWIAVRDELTRFLAVPRSPEIRARARFYLGQSYYFLRQPREGLFEFLSIQDKYPVEAAEWIRASLDMLKK